MMRCFLTTGDEGAREKEKRGGRGVVRETERVSGECVREKTRVNEN